MDEVTEEQFMLYQQELVSELEATAPDYGVGKMYLKNDYADVYIKAYKIAILTRITRESIKRKKH